MVTPSDGHTEPDAGILPQAHVADDGCIRGDPVPAIGRRRTRCLPGRQAVPLRHTGRWHGPFLLTRSAGGGMPHPPLGIPLPTTLWFQRAPGKGGRTVGRSSDTNASGRGRNPRAKGRGHEWELGLTRFCLT